MQSYFLINNIVLGESGIYYAFSNSDIMGQVICGVLFVFSMCTWIVMIEKILSLKKIEHDCKRFTNEFKDKRNPLAMRFKAPADPSPAARVFQSACDRLETLQIENPSGGRRALNDAEIQIIRTTMDQTIQDEILILEKRMMFLATAVSASPFLGLFGTVWGITVAFTNLAIAGKADIQTLAPGVSGALLTTVIALVVAIPSLVGYNIITTHIRKQIVLLDNFSEEVAVRFKIEQLDTLKKFSGENRQ